MVGFKWTSGQFVVNGIFVSILADLKSPGNKSAKHNFCSIIEKIQQVYLATEWVFLDSVISFY